MELIIVDTNWEKYLPSFTEDYEKYPPRNDEFEKWIPPIWEESGLYYDAEQDIAVLATPTGQYMYQMASEQIKGPAHTKLYEIMQEAADGEIDLQII